MSGPLLEVEELGVSFAAEGGSVRAVEGVSLELRAGETLAVVGESGAGKSALAMALTGLSRFEGAEVTGSVRYRGAELVGAAEEELRRVRGAEIAMVFQDPMGALNPVRRVGGQIVEALELHGVASGAEARERTVELLRRVQTPRPEQLVRAYPHELSGGLRQRVVIALALSCDPSVLIADEPTTALDVTTQAQVLERIRALAGETGTAVMLVTHDLGVVAGMADRVAVMYSGRIVEEGSPEEIFHDAQHPYTWGLLGSLARLDRVRPQRLPTIPGAPAPGAAKPAGCHFRPRCQHEFEACDRVPALERRVGEGAHRDRCWLEPERKRELRPG